MKSSMIAWSQLLLMKKANLCNLPVRDISKIERFCGEISWTLRTYWKYSFTYCFSLKHICTKELLRPPFNSYKPHLMFSIQVWGWTWVLPISGHRSDKKKDLKSSPKSSQNNVIREMSLHLLRMAFFHSLTNFKMNPLGKKKN